MKAFLWGVTVLLALVWTGGVALSVQIIQWAAGALANSDGTGIAEAMSSIPMPEWLAPWIDIAGWSEWLQAVAASLEWVSGVLPFAAQSLDWVGPVLWIVWALGLISLLILAVVISRFTVR